MRLHDKGLVYRGSYLVNWSPAMQTAVSDLEARPRPGRVLPSCPTPQHACALSPPRCLCGHAWQACRRAP